MHIHLEVNHYFSTNKLYELENWANTTVDMVNLTFFMKTRISGTHFVG